MGIGGRPLTPEELQRRRFGRPEPGKTHVAVHAGSDAAPWEQEATEDMGLTVSRPSPHHVQFRDDEDKVVANWWPGKGTTTTGENTRGPKCQTGEDVIAWLKML
mgnify:FL=1